MLVKTSCGFREWISLSISIHFRNPPSMMLYQHIKFPNEGNLFIINQTFRNNSPLSFILLEHFGTLSSTNAFPNFKSSENFGFQCASYIFKESLHFTFGWCILKVARRPMEKLNCKFCIFYFYLWQYCYEPLTLSLY